MTLSSMSIDIENSSLGDSQIMLSWVNPNYPNHGSVGRDQAIYMQHINNYIENYANTFSWENYCLNQDINIFPYF